MKSVEVPVSVHLEGGGWKTYLITVPDVADHDSEEATTRKAIELATKYGHKDVRPFLVDSLSRKVIEAVEEQHGVTLDTDSVMDAVQEIRRTGADRIVHHGEDEYTLFISADRSTVFVAKNVITVS